MALVCTKIIVQQETSRSLRCSQTCLLDICQKDLACQQQKNYDEARSCRAVANDKIELATACKTLVFTARCTECDACRPCVRPSLTLVDQDHIDSTILETNCTGNLSAHRKSPFTDALSNGSIPDPLRPHLPQDWGFATPTKTPIAIISGTGKATDFKFGQYIHTFTGSIRTKGHQKFWRKGSVGVCRDCPFLVPPITSGMGKATDFKFGQYIHRVHPNKSPLKILEKGERGCIQGLPKFFGTPYDLRNG